MKINKEYYITILAVCIIACGSVASQPAKSVGNESAVLGAVKAQKLDEVKVEAGASVDKKSESKVSNVENSFHPIVVNGELLGGFDKQKPVKPGDFKAYCNGRLVPYEEFCCEEESDISRECELFIDLVKGGETFQLYDFFSSDSKPMGILTDSQNSGMGKGGIINHSYVGAGFDFYHLQIDRQHAVSRETKPHMTVSINGDWDALPRPIVALGNDEFSVDINGDGKLDSIQMYKSISSFEIPDYTEKLRQKGKIKIVVKIDGREHTLSEIEIDGIYTSNYAFALIDIDNDSAYEFVETTYGHDRYIWVSKLNIDSDGKISTKHLFEHEVAN